MTGTTLQDGQAELPAARSTQSYWHREPSRRLLGHRTTARVPAEADVVVVGSGITGAFAARRLAEGGRAVLMLEAREACWGATGRNDDLCQPGVWTNKPAVARFELATFHQLASLIADNDIACDWQSIDGVHALFSRSELEAARRQVRRLQKHGDLRDKAVLVEGAAALAKLRIPEAVGAVYQPVAAKCWPYKLVAWVLQRLLREHAVGGRFNLQTGTPVLHLQRLASSYVVHTTRGQVAARHVVLATNAYTSHLVPRMTGLIVPVRGQVCALVPPRGAVLLPHSYAWVAGGSDDYPIQRGGRDDEALLLGGERLAVAGGQEGLSRDDVDPVIGHNLRRALGSALKLRQGSAAEAPELEATYEWTGIMGFSRDHPWVGAVPARLLGVDEAEAGGLWISAGYTGHGMPVAARCGVAVADMILGRPRGVAVPQEFVMSVERATRERLMELQRTIRGELGMREE